MKHDVRIYDNLGKTIDRYTVVIDESVYNMSAYPNTPNGVNMYVGMVKDCRFNKSERVKGNAYTAMIPTDIKKAILMRMEQVIEIPCFDIRLILTPDFNTDGHYSGQITSTLKEEDYAISDENSLRDQYGSAIDAIESMILAHACAGIDIESPAYIEGIETSVQAISDNLS